MWNDWSLKIKLAVPISVIALLVVLLSIQQMSSSSSITSDFSTIYESYVPALDYTLNADRDLYQAQVAERSIAMGASGNDLVKQHSENISQVRERIGKVAALDISPKINEYCKTFLAALESWSSNSQNMVRNRASGSMSIDEASELSQGRLDSEFESIRNILDKLGEEISKDSLLLAEEVRETSDSAQFVTMVLTIAVLAIMGFIAVFFPRLILTQLERMQETLNSILSGHGDLTARLPVAGNDELGVLGKSFNSLLMSLQELVAGVVETANHVEKSADDLNKAAAENSQSIETQAHSLNSVATAVNEMGAAIHEVSGNTQNVSSEANNATENANDVTNTFNNAMSEIGALATNVESSAEVIGKLEEEAQGIVSVLDVIKGIAEQTNLLALNAAIEAARAGEQGRGFAVVADEVRSLASRTQESTEHINEMIARLQAGVNESVRSMMEGKEKASTTVNLASEAEEAIGQITGYLSSISGHIIQVASAVEEQTAVVEEINKNVTSVNDLSQAGTERAKFVSTSTAELHDYALQLKQQMSRFKI